MERTVEDPECALENKILMGKKGQKHVKKEEVPQKQKERSIGYFSSMDVLRFICAAGVIFHHATEMASEKGVQTRAKMIHHFSGAFFLDVFFVISGFLIAMILIREYETGSFSLKNFYIRRIIRIWPLYFLVVIVRILIIPVMSGMPPDVIKTNMLYASTFTVNFQMLAGLGAKTYAILWSICIEEHIYLLLPLFLLLFSGKFRPLAIAMIIVGALSWIGFKSNSKEGLSIPYFLSTSYFYYFGLGMLIACIRNGLVPGTNLEKILFRPGVQVFVMLIFGGFIFNAWGSHKTLEVNLIMHGLFATYLVWGASQRNFVIRLGDKVSRYLGNISYAMYISHVILISLAIGIFKRKHIAVSEGAWGWGLPLFALILTIVLATILYYFFERPILKLKKKFTTVSNK